MTTILQSLIKEAGEAELAMEQELCAVCGEGKASLIVLRTCDTANNLPPYMPGGKPRSTV